MTPLHPQTTMTMWMKHAVMRLALLSVWFGLAWGALLAATAVHASEGRRAWDDGGTPAALRTPHAAGSTLALAELPRQARQTWERIHAGGPFAFEKDGTVFRNREGLLPQRPRGFWREYTVLTPRKRGRGARRIVCGGMQPAKPEVCYWTADHYASFARIVP